MVLIDFRPLNLLYLYGLQVPIQVFQSRARLNLFSIYKLLHLLLSLRIHKSRNFNLFLRNLVIIDNLFIGILNISKCIQGREFYLNPIIQVKVFEYLIIKIFHNLKSSFPLLSLRIFQQCQQQAKFNFNLYFFIKFL